MEEKLKVFQTDLFQNRNGGIRWIDPKLLPAIPGKSTNSLVQDLGRRAARPKHKHKDHKKMGHFFKAKHVSKTFNWESEWKELKAIKKGPKIDYTKHSYIYPDLLLDLPTPGEYPPLQKLGDMFQNWPQDHLDNPPDPFLEKLLHFDFTDPKQLEAAKTFRDAELPFKIYNVPEIISAKEKWTDEYLTRQFDPPGRLGIITGERVKNRSEGACQESHNNFFTFFNQDAWDVPTMGLAPTRNNDYTFSRWASHARMPTMSDSILTDLTFIGRAVYQRKNENNPKVSGPLCPMICHRFRRRKRHSLVTIPTSKRAFSADLVNVE